jgi:lysyl-tRNA synthetase class 2
VGDTSIEYQGERIDLGQKFGEITSGSCAAARQSRALPENIRDRAALVEACAAHGMEAHRDAGAGRLQYELFEKAVEATLRGPVFVTQYPAEVSPLARCNNQDPFVTDRFELFIGGRELANGFAELNDPEEQAARFQAQAAAKAGGDEEAMFFDADYIRALEYGMPPTAGLGVGIDRLAMLLTNSASIRDVLLFPLLKPETWLAPTILSPPRARGSAVRCCRNADRTPYS